MLRKRTVPGVHQVMPMTREPSPSNAPVTRRLPMP
nr:MAG TPA: hypothetical protein [Caudoviricetes sp.]